MNAGVRIADNRLSDEFDYRNRLSNWVRQSIAHPVFLNCVLECRKTARREMISTSGGKAVHIVILDIFIAQYRSIFIAVF
jgi:hypothetical protein